MMKNLAASHVTEFRGRRCNGENQPAVAAHVADYIDCASGETSLPGTPLPAQE